MRKLRGNEIAHDLPGADEQPQPGLHRRRPDLRGGRAAHEGVARRRRRTAPIESLRMVGIAYPGAARQAVSARAVGRHAPARHDRDGALVRAQAAHRRRADDGPGRDHPGADPGAHPPIQEQHRHGLDAHHARPGRGRRDGRRRRGHVRAAASSSTARVEEVLLQPQAPLHRRACWPRSRRRACAASASTSSRARCPTRSTCPRAATSRRAARTASSRARRSIRASRRATDRRSRAGCGSRRPATASPTRLHAGTGRRRAAAAVEAAVTARRRADASCAADATDERRRRRPPRPRRDRGERRHAAAAGRAARPRSPHARPAPRHDAPSRSSRSRTSSSTTRSGRRPARARSATCGPSTASASTIDEGRDPRPGGRVGLRQVHAGQDAASGCCRATSGRGDPRRRGHLRARRATTSSGCGGGCRSSSRTRSARSTRACPSATSSARASLAQADNENRWGDAQGARQARRRLPRGGRACAATTPGATRTSSPAASASASASPGRSRSSPSSSSATSRCPRSTCRSSRQILNLLLDLRGEFGLTYLFIAHNLSVVQYI